MLRRVLKKGLKIINCLELGSLCNLQGLQTSVLCGLIHIAVEYVIGFLKVIHIKAIDQIAHNVGSISREEERV